MNHVAVLGDFISMRRRYESLGPAAPIISFDPRSDSALKNPILFS